mmetsp:Transcript_42194/g.86278  ORF Transcript_42194/g.86278 Transcript_42194/m.86278 type:complete len:214 (+) Transcript_42194:358-999(+)
MLLVRLELPPVHPPVRTSVGSFPMNLGLMKVPLIHISICKGLLSRTVSHSVVVLPFIPVALCKDLHAPSVHLAIHPFPLVPSTIRLDVRPCSMHLPIQPFSRISCPIWPGKLACLHSSNTLRFRLRWRSGSGLLLHHPAGWLHAPQGKCSTIEGVSDSPEQNAPTNQSRLGSASFTQVFLPSPFRVPSVEQLCGRLSEKTMNAGCGANRKYLH